MNGYKLLLMPLLAGIVFSCVKEPEAPLSDGQIPQETYAPDDEGGTQRMGEDKAAR